MSDVSYRRHNAKLMRLQRVLAAVGYLVMTFNSLVHCRIVKDAVIKRGSRYWDIEAAAEDAKLCFDLVAASWVITSSLQRTAD